VKKNVTNAISSIVIMIGVRVRVGEFVDYSRLGTWCRATYDRYLTR